MNLSLTSTVFATIWALILMADAYLDSSEIRRSADLIVSTMFLVTSWILQTIENNRQ